ncbi:hypothetical protein G6011_07253 [Alternaria panax]|uniref:DUF1996 domain-containing protein n=1 Tax=Alternaria panax TaxID=48097 RepID=A0AAD4I5C4_9PLEO|nr:hypothetical protein G6011_07253 [Alternaria panax]
MVNLRLPTSRNGKDLDSPDHMAHMAYPVSGTFESQGPCPASHPVRMPQLMYDVIYETAPFNDPSLWPEDGIQPLVYSFDDHTGYDEEWYVGCSPMETQSMEMMNNCSVPRKVIEDIGDQDWIPALPGHSNATWTVASTGKAFRA